MLDAGRALTAVVNRRNYGGLWWNAPGGSEAGWGINFAHQGATIFASWFTYDLTGKAWWLVMSANQTAPNSYTGTLFQATGPAFDAMPEVLKQRIDGRLWEISAARTRARSSRRTGKKIGKRSFKVCERRSLDRQRIGPALKSRWRGDATREWLLDELSVFGSVASHKT